MQNFLLKLRLNKIICNILSLDKTLWAIFNSISLQFNTILLSIRKLNDYNQLKTIFQISFLQWSLTKQTTCTNDRYPLIYFHQTRVSDVFHWKLDLPLFLPIACRVEIQAPDEERHAKKQRQRERERDINPEEQNPLTREMMHSARLACPI